MLSEEEDEIEIEEYVDDIDDLELTGDDFIDERYIEDEEIKEDMEDDRKIWKMKI